MLLAYFSPEMTLPLASILSAVVGFFVLVGRAPIRFVKQAWCNLFRSKAAAPVSKTTTEMESS